MSESKGTFLKDGWEECSGNLRTLLQDSWVCMEWEGTHQVKGGTQPAASSDFRGHECSR